MMKGRLYCLKSGFLLDTRVLFSKCRVFQSHSQVWLLFVHPAEISIVGMMVKYGYNCAWKKTDHPIHM